MIHFVYFPAYLKVIRYIYIGQTGCSVLTKFNEHAHSFHSCNSNSIFSHQFLHTGHAVNKIMSMFTLVTGVIVIPHFPISSFMLDMQYMQ